MTLNLKKGDRVHLWWFNGCTLPVEVTGVGTTQVSVRHLGGGDVDRVEQVFPERIVEYQAPPRPREEKREEEEQIGMVY